MTIRYVWIKALVMAGLGLMMVGLGTACSASIPGAVVTPQPTATPRPSATSQPTDTPQPTATHSPSPSATPDDQVLAEPVSEATPTLEAASTQEATSTPAQENADVDDGDLRIFLIIPEKSEVRFIIDEDLFGNPKTVIGRTRGISGTLTVDLEGLQETQLSSVRVDARDLRTDDDFRNRALRRQILRSAQDEYQYIWFEPAAFEGLPMATAVSIGEPFSFDITGDLTIRDIANPVTFAMTATAISQSELSVSGMATVLRSDYELAIPTVPGVANVSEEVQLALDLVAVATE